MIIKKYQASSETDAITLAKEELGKDAIVMNVKKITPKGVYRFFKRMSVEVTAAVDDNKIYTGDTKKVIQKSNNKNETSSLLEEKIGDLQKLIERQIESKKAEEVENRKIHQVQLKEQSENEKSVTDDCIQLIKKQLIKHEVVEEYAEQIIKEVQDTIINGAPVDNILTAIYQKIVLKLGQASVIDTDEGNPKYIFFMGPTGVGKTTTIAKIASDFKLNKKLNIALLTSDTYRIAAVEQLRIYANILKVPLHVVYTADEIKQIQHELDKYDVVLIDTAGRSHKNMEQRDDLRKILNTIEPKNRSEYLVLSATTKYNDLINIVKTYKDIDNYRLLFTKLDETTNVGNILNIKLLTNAKLSYVAFGQDVPSDIGKLDAQNIAKQLLGGDC